MKCLILNPPSFDNFEYIKEGRCESRKGGQLTPPVTLGIISALLTKNGFENDLFDFMADPIPKKELENINYNDYDIAFVSISAPTFEFDKKVGQLIKEKNKGILLCALGVMAKAIPNKVLESFDVSILGEPELTTLDIVKQYKNGKIQLESVKGIAFKKKGKIIMTQSRPLINNLDNLPFQTGVRCLILDILTLKQENLLQ